MNSFLFLVSLLPLKITLFIVYLLFLFLKNNFIHTAFIGYIFCLGWDLLRKFSSFSVIFWKHIKIFFFSYDVKVCVLLYFRFNFFLKKKSFILIIFTERLLSARPPTRFKQAKSAVEKAEESPLCFPPRALVIAFISCDTLTVLVSQGQHVIFPLWSN